MTKNEIKARVKGIIAKYSDSEIFLYSQEYDDEFISGIPFNLNANRLVYLYYEIKKIFEINIPLEELDNYHFSTINGITEIVDKYML